MTTKRLVVEFLDGSTRIIIPSPNFIQKRMKEFGETEDEAIAFVQTKDVPADALNVRVVEASALPQSRAFRNCWRIKAGACVVDLPLARVQKMAEIRAERNRRLAETDGPALRAMGAGGVDQVLEAKRQVLRDIPASAQTALDALTTADELEVYQPTWP